MGKRHFALGLDFGTNSVRALIADIQTGEEVSSFVHDYTRGEDGIILDARDPNLARQHPLEYTEGMERAVKGALEAAAAVRGFAPGSVIGIGVDTTGSTPIPVDGNGLPLAFHKDFESNPNAMAWLWKDHTAHEEAAAITERAHQNIPDYTTYCGGIYSSEWYFSKIWHLAKVDPAVYSASASFVEHCDLMPALLAGDTRPAAVIRSRCAAGHKAMFNAHWGGLPSQGFLTSLDSRLDGLNAKLYEKSHTADTRVGGLCKEWAARLGLAPGTAIAGGAFDAHMGAVASGIKPGVLVKIMGTSTCDMMVVPPGELKKAIKGICGQVDGSITPGLTGLEAGQSAVGDIFAWYRDETRWALGNLLPLTGHGSQLSQEQLAKIMSESRTTVYRVLSERASSLRPGESGLLSLDWLNGNRTVLVDPNLTGMLLGLTLATEPHEVFRALIEGTAFGARIIMDRFESYRIHIDEIVTCGGLPNQNPFLMQLYADILGRTIKIARSGQTCALGAAMFGAVAAGPGQGGFRKVEEAQAAMSGLSDSSYKPDSGSRDAWAKLYALYKKLHDSFGTQGCNEDLFPVMKELLAIKRSVTH